MNTGRLQYCWLERAKYSRQKYAEKYNENEVESISPYEEAAFHLKSKQPSIWIILMGWKLSYEALHKIENDLLISDLFFKSKYSVTSHGLVTSFCELWLEMKFHNLFVWLYIS